jgi:hypothetical protein
MGEELQLGFLKELKGTKISNEKEDHNYNFESEPPYEVISNKYMGVKELNIIKKVEEALEKYHNKGCYKRTMEYIFVKNKLNPFDTFLLLKEKSNKELKYLNDDESYKHLFDTLKSLVNEKEYLDTIKLDYLLKNKLKPKIWWNQTIKKEDKQKYFERFNKEYGIDNFTFYNYSYIDIIDNKVYVFIYKDNEIDVKTISCD